MPTVQERALMAGAPSPSGMAASVSAQGRGYRGQVRW
jgi:hypothetical protein